MSEGIKKAVIIHQGALGDLINTLPAIQALGQVADELIGIGRRYFKLLEHCQVVKRFIGSEAIGFYQLFGEDFEPKPELRKVFEGAELIVSWLGRSSESYQKNLYKLGKRVAIFKGSFPPPPGSAHITKILAQPVEELGIEITDYIPRLKLPKAMDRDFSGEDRFFAIHPGSGSGKKNLPVQVMVELLVALDGAFPDRRLLLLLGEAEQVLGVELLERIPKAVLAKMRIISNLDLINLAYLLKSAELYIGMDSGISHLACALGTKSVVIFGPTDPKVWAPKQKWAQVIQSHYPCAPCSDERRRNCEELFCWEVIKKEEIIENVRILVESNI